MTTKNYVVGTGEGAHYASINEAMEVVAAGDSVTLQPGLYEELVKIPQDVSLVAGVNCSEEEDMETTITNGVIILANVTMRGVQVRGRVDIRKGHAVLENCDVHHGSDGVRVGPKCKLTLRASRVHHCVSGGDGVYFMEGSSGEVEDTDIYECRVNCVHVNNASVVLRSNRIRDCMFGVYYQGGASGLVENNSLEHVKKFGIYVVGDSDPVVRGNTVRECGIQCAMVSQGGKGLWTDNTFDGSIHVLAGSEAKLGENRVSGKTDIAALAAAVPATGAAKK